MGGDFPYGHKHKSALVGTGVGQAQPLLFQALAGVIHKIKIERAGGVGDTAPAPEAVFDVLQAG